MRAHVAVSSRNTRGRRAGRLTPAELLLRSVTEAEWQEQVIELAHALGWRVAHFRPARTQHGWRTPVAGDGAGFPDLLLVRGARVIVAELKREGPGHEPTPEQVAWLDAFGAADIEAHIWRPGDIDEIAAELAHS
jgi:hypothetical protein